MAYLFCQTFSNSGTYSHDFYCIFNNDADSKASIDLLAKIIVFYETYIELNEIILTYASGDSVELSSIKDLTFCEGSFISQVICQLKYP